MSETLFIWCFILWPVPLIFVPVQAFKLRTTAKARGISIGIARLLGISFVSVIAAFVLGCAVGYLVWFGPSHITGNWGLPWFTGLPAVAIAMWVMAKVNITLCVFLIDRIGQRLNAAGERDG